MTTTDPGTSGPRDRREITRAEAIPPSLARWLEPGVSAAKHYTRGTHRGLLPSESLARARTIAARAGVTRVSNITGLDTIGVPVFAVYRPNARSLAVSQGKGLDPTAAAVSGLMEAIESYHAEHVSLPLRLASYDELRAEVPVVDVTGLPRLASTAFHPRRPTLWIEGVELLADQPMWLPYETVHTNFSLPLPTGSGAFLMSSNGLASGNHPLEALSHALCEVVERDAVGLWSLGETALREQRRVDPATIGDPECSQVLAMLTAAGVAFGIWDVTTDVGLAAFVCEIVDREPSSFRFLYSARGSGCHPAREVALLRALTEAVQCRLTYISGARDDGDRAFFERQRDPARVDQVRSHLLSAPGTRSFEAVASHDHATFEADVAWELACLRHAGITQAVAVDLSKAEFGVPVMRVVVPGLESLHDAPGYVPGARARKALLQRRPS